MGGGTAGEFSKYGANLALIDNNQERLDALVAALEERGHHEDKVGCLSEFSLMYRCTPFPLFYPNVFKKVWGK